MEIKEQDLIDICMFCYEAGFSDGYHEATPFDKNDEYRNIIKQLNNGRLCFLNESLEYKLKMFRVNEVLKIFHLEHILEG